MPAPKTPNTAAAREAAAATFEKRRIQKAIELLREAGYTVIPPRA